MYQALEVASSEAAAPAAASALYIYYVVIGGRFAPPYKYMVKYIKQKQQQEQQFQSLLPPELDTLTLHEGGLPNIKRGLPLSGPLEYTGPFLHFCPHSSWRNLLTGPTKNQFAASFVLVPVQKLNSSA